MEGPLPEFVRGPDRRRVWIRLDRRRCALLPGIDELPLNPPYERVLQAIVRLAEGDIDQLHYYAGEAGKDWRDVLYWTGI